MWLIQGDTGSELGDIIIIIIIIVVIIIIIFIVLVIIVIITVTIKGDLYPRHMGLAGDTGSELVPGERNLKFKLIFLSNQILIWRQEKGNLNTQWGKSQTNAARRKESKVRN